MKNLGDGTYRLDNGYLVLKAYSEYQELGWIIREDNAAGYEPSGIYWETRKEAVEEAEHLAKLARERGEYITAEYGVTR